MTKIAAVIAKLSHDVKMLLVLQAEYRSIIFSLCYFHAALLERKKFGVGNLPAATSGIGWNMNYPFNTGDLLCCGQCASNYLENNVKVCPSGLCCPHQLVQSSMYIGCLLTCPV